MSEQLYNPKHIGVVMLSNASTDKHAEMTINALKSLYNSEDSDLYEFETFVLESNKEASLNFEKYFNIHLGNITIFNPPLEKEFNYNKFLNIGFQHLKIYEEYLKVENKFDYFVITNNDLIFEKNWFTEMDKAFSNNPNLSSASPFCPDYKLHEGFEVKDLNYGYRTSVELTGWCIVIKASVLEKILPFDERFKFYYQDNDYSMVLQTQGLQHALVSKSHVKHLFSQSHDLIEPSKYHEFTDGAGKIFKEKWFK